MGTGFLISGWGWGWVLRTASANISRNSVLVFPGVGFHGLKYMGTVVLSLEVGNRLPSAVYSKPRRLVEEEVAVAGDRLGAVNVGDKLFSK